MATKDSYLCWNHRVVRYNKRLLAIHEAFYYSSKPPDHSVTWGRPNQLTLNGVMVVGSSKKELRETLLRMLRALDKPVLRFKDYATKEEWKKKSKLR